MTLPSCARQVPLALPSWPRVRSVVLPAVAGSGAAPWSIHASLRPVGVDFGTTAQDYAAHRAGFPKELFDRLATMGIGRSGQRLLDLGTGTGTLARGFARRGASVVGTDPSEPL